MPSLILRIRALYFRISSLTEFLEKVFQAGLDSVLLQINVKHVRKHRCGCDALGIFSTENV